MIRGVGGDRVDGVAARAVAEPAEIEAAGAFVVDGDLVEHGAVAAAPARSWAPRARLDEQAAAGLRGEIAVGIARLIVG